MAVRPLKVINPPARKPARKPAAKPRARARAANPPAPRRRAPRRKNPSMRDDIMHAVSAGAGGAVAAYVNTAVHDKLPDAAQNWSPALLGVLTLILMPYLGKRNPTLRAAMLGAIGSFSAQQLISQEVIDPIPMVVEMKGLAGRGGRLGALPAPQRIASILGSGPGRANMGYLSAGGPAQLGYLSRGGPYEQPLVGAAY